jgi:hypothetical protein
LAGLCLFGLRVNPVWLILGGALLGLCGGRPGP